MNMGHIADFLITEGATGNGPNFHLEVFKVSIGRAVAISKASCKGRGAARPVACRGGSYGP